jgi:hypothetical protein
MTDDQEWALWQKELALWNHRAAQVMDKMGGGFAAAIALAYFRADSDNKARLLEAFPDLFAKYRQWARDLHDDEPGA